MRKAVHHLRRWLLRGPGRRRLTPLQPPTPSPAVFDGIEGPKPPIRTKLDHLFSEFGFAEFAGPTPPRPPKNYANVP
jgi:hypothetical protein